MLKMIGFEAEEETTTALFDQLAKEGTYHLSFSDVRDWLTSTAEDDGDAGP
jgi:hypothetical protein